MPFTLSYSNYLYILVLSSGFDTSYDNVTAANSRDRLRLQYRHMKLLMDKIFCKIKSVLVPEHHGFLPGRSAMKLIVLPCLPTLIFWKQHVLGVNNFLVDCTTRHELRFLQHSPRLHRLGNDIGEHVDFFNCSVIQLKKSFLGILTFFELLMFHRFLLFIFRC